MPVSFLFEENYDLGSSLGPITACLGVSFFVVLRFRVFRSLVFRSLVFRSLGLCNRHKRIPQIIAFSRERHRHQTIVVLFCFVTVKLTCVCCLFSGGSVKTHPFVCKLHLFPGEIDYKNNKPFSVKQNMLGCRCRFLEGK